jgi:hypothetical protein|tara:strand:+ start:69 stop:491 length:423 start_codon:yes stop_codon:yes gene_type:complete
MYIVTENKKILTPISVTCHYLFKGIESILQECSKEQEFIEHIPSNAELIYDDMGDCKTLKFSKDVFVHTVKGYFKIKRIALFENFNNKYDGDLIVLELECNESNRISYGYIEYCEDEDYTYNLYNLKLDGDFDFRMLNKS